MDFDNSGSPGRFFASLVRELKSLAICNIEYFKDGKHSHHAKFHVAFCMLFEYLDLGIEPCFREISLRVHEFDASPKEKGNGYRSMLRIVQKCCLHLLQIARHVSTNKDSVLFRRAFYMKELEAYVATLGQLRACLYYAQKLMTYCRDGQLFADEDTLDDALAAQLMMDVEMLSQDCFFGRCLGFQTDRVCTRYQEINVQFCESMHRPLSVVAIAMASFAEGYQEHSQLMKVATSLFNSGKYIINPDLRAQQVVNVTRTADIQFCKAFWSITESEIMHQLPSMVCPTVQVDEVFLLGPDAFNMPSADPPEGKDDEVTITPPCAHTGPAPVQVRLLSYQLREGQEQHLKSSRSPSTRTPPPRAARSPALVIHCHGGGFVAQSSRSHEVYLRHWARDLSVPILSIDYSLAPESPFPRALEECFYVYAWAVHNCLKLGSTGEVIVMAGDSAGANLVISTAMRAVSANIRRPDGILGVYTPVLVRYTPSPARLLSLMDPLLPAGILSRCLAAYAGVCDEVSSQLATSVSCHIESSAATLRMSSQENHDDSGWVVVSQDSAARTNTTLSSSVAKHTHDNRLSSSSVDQSDSKDAANHMEDDVELFSRPRGTASTPTGGGGGSMLSAMVSGATDRLVSYVGSYTHLLAKTFSSSLPRATSSSSLSPSPSSSEHIPLLSIPEHGPCQSASGRSSGDGGGGVARKRNSQVESQASRSSSTEDSPHSPSFHTPLSTPSAEHISGLPQPGGQKGVEGSTSSSVPMDPDHQQDLVDICLEDDDDIAPSGDSSSLLQSALSSVTRLEDAHDGGESQLAVSEGSEPATMLVGDSDSQQAVEAEDSERHKSEVSTAPEGLQMEMDHSAASTTLPSTSTLSTPSEDHLSSDQTLPADGTAPDRRAEGRERTCPEQSDSSPSPSYKSPSQYGKQSGSVSPPGDCAKQDGSSPSLSFKSPSDDSWSLAKELPAEPAEKIPRTEAEGRTGEDGNMETAVADRSPPLLASSAEYVDLVKATCTTPDMELTMSSSSAIHAAATILGHHPLADPLLSPDSGCLSDETDKLETSSVSAVDAAAVGIVGGGGARSKCSPSRHDLHLHLRKTTSSSSSLSRSASLPVLGEGLSTRSHSMSPSDFKRERHLAQSPMRVIRNTPLVKNPYMSPLLAPDWLLEGLPHVCLVACHLDPLLDDSVMFTRRLRSLGRTVELVLIDDLPHGFLNFSLVSRDAKAASDLCMRKLRDLLKLDQLEGGGGGTV